MRKARWNVLITVALAAGLIGLAPATMAGGDSDSDSGGPRVVRVDCTHADPGKHDSIAKALRKKADELVVEIDGICVEDVVIRRDFVTVRGRNQNPDLDGIHGATPGVVLGGSGDEAIKQAVVLVEGGDGVRLEDLFVGEGLENRSGVFAVGWAIVTLSGCRVANNPDLGVAAAGGSTLFLEESEVMGNGSFAGGSTGSAPLIVNDSDLRGGLLGVNAGVVIMHRGSLSGTILAAGKSTVDLEQVPHTGVFNILATASTLRLLGSTLRGLTLVTDFSTLVVRNESIVEGSLACEAGGDAFCRTPAADVTGTSYCSQCLKP